MLRKVVLGKIHQARVTQCVPGYSGSITIDATLLKASGMRPCESVLIADSENGNRFETYIIEGEADSGAIYLNGAAAELVNVGDRVIIIAFGYVDAEEMDKHIGRVVIVDENNRIKEKLTYQTVLKDDKEE